MIYFIFCIVRVNYLAHTQVWVSICTMASVYHNLHQLTWAYHRYALTPKLVGTFNSGYHG